MKFTLLLVSFLLTTTLLAQQENHYTDKQKEIVERYLTNGAHQYGYTSKHWQTYLDSAVTEDSTIAYVWQQKGMPLWKARKYEAALEFTNKAVKYDRERYLGWRAYLKCIFQKDYRGTLKDIAAAKAEFGDSYQNDHSLTFYESLCHLGLNDFTKANAILLAHVNKDIKEHGANWIHYAEYFYLGITYYELEDYDAAIKYFELSLKEFEDFGDATYWLARAYYYKGDKTSAETHIERFKTLQEKANTFTEGGSPYEMYPYQVVSGR